VSRGSGEVSGSVGVAGRLNCRCILMSTQASERRSLRSVWKTGWRLLSLTVAAVLALAVYVGLTVGENVYVALAAVIGVGPFLVLPMTRRIAWLIVASVASFVVTLLLVAVG